MKSIWILLTIFVLILNTRGGFCQTCDFDAVSQCLDNSNIPEELYTPADQYGLQKFQKDSLRSYCSIYNNEIRGCLDDATQACTGYLGAMYQGFRDAFDYLCNEGYEGFVEHQDCFTSNTTANKVERCVDQATAAAYSLGYDFSEKKVCSLLDDALDCLVDATEESCGKEASQWMDTFLRKLADPIMDTMDCDTMDIAKLVGIIVGCVVGVAVLLTCVCCMCAAVRRQKRNANAPPPYVTQAQVVQRAVPVTTGEKMGPPPSYFETFQGLPAKQM